MSTQSPPSVLFVCLGNICRSPMAEAVFAHLVSELGVKDRVGKIDSCGTGAYHQGERADGRTLAVLSQHNIPSTCRARKLKGSDFDEFDYVLGMDSNNVRNLRAQAPRGSKARIELFSAWDDGKEVKDPYYGSDNGFERCYVQCRRYSLALLQHMQLIDAATAEVAAAR